MYVFWKRIHDKVKAPSVEVHVEWLKSSLHVDGTEGCGNCIKWRIIKKNELFSCALVVRYGNIYWHDKLLVNQYLHITTCSLFEILINPEKMSFKIHLRLGLQAVF